MARQRPLAVDLESMEPPRSRRRLAEVDHDKARRLEERKVECPVCYEPLPFKPQLAFLMKDGKRSCKHYFCAQCAQKAKQECNGECPHPGCGGKFDDCSTLPDIKKDPRGWFQAIDVDSSRSVDKDELIGVLASTFHVGSEALKRDFPKLFGGIEGAKLTFDRLFSVDINLLQRLQLLEARPSREGPPRFQEKYAWFTYWDEDDSGALDQGEVLRALVKSYSFFERPEQRQQLKECLASIWFLFDCDGSGGLDAHEFSKDGGLGDALIDNLPSESAAFMD